MALVEAHLEVVPNASADRKAAGPSSAVSVKNVLFATDFSASSEAALPYAAAICRRFGSTLHIVHVLSDASLLLVTGGVDYVSMGTIYEDAHTEAKEKLAEIATRLEGIPQRSYVRHGQVWRSLNGIIEDNQVDMIVVGTHGRTGLGKLLLGSVAEDILRHAPCPVLTVGPKVSGHARLPAFPARGHDLAPLELELQQIVLATNFAPSAAHIAQRSGQTRRRILLAPHSFARDRGLRATREPPGPDGRGVRRLQALIPADAALQYPAETVLEFGSPAERILKVAAEREADMIVLGTRSAADIGSTHLPWSSAHHVIAQAHCPVLTIRE